ncbi:restriction endonuclease subunit S [Morganella morganii]
MAKYKAYPEYKDSGVEWLGVIPVSWKVTRLKLETLLNMGQSPSSDDCNIEGNGLAFLQGNAEFGKINPIEKQYCPVAKKTANPGDILFSVRAPVGAINYADKKYGIGRGLCSISESKKIISSFLWWLLPTYKYQLDAIATGSTFEAVSAEQLGNLSFTLPSISEQFQIADFLDHETAKIDNLIEKQQQLIELLKEKRQAVISHAVTKGLNPDVPMKDSGVEWLGEVPEHWELVPLKYLCNFSGGERRQKITYLIGKGGLFHGFRRKI